MRTEAKVIGVLLLSITLSVTAAESYQRKCEVLDGVVVCKSLADELANLPAAEKGQRLYRETDRRHGPLMGYGSPGYGDSQSKFIAVVRDPDGTQKTREIRLKYLENSPDGNKRLMVFDKPKDLKRYAMLTISHKDNADEQWVYDPENNQVKRILSNNAFTPFSGTDITFEDISSQDVTKYDYQYERDAQLEGADCYIVNRFPKDKYSGYQRLETWIDKNTYLIKKIDYYDRKGVLLKTLTMDNYQQFNDKYWRAGEMRMKNHQSGRSTQLVWSEYQFNTGLTEADFSLNSLKNVN
ncbi:MAG: outer membrane lipoprotein-sorting protein [Pseudomonadales bacterium]|nr:outer membrane lipoprotein-sorting protein [Pseudomonadales bacterium]